ncbi:hypothetical protein D3C72_758740 [compost metagenome]
MLSGQPVLLRPGVGKVGFAQIEGVASKAGAHAVRHLTHAAHAVGWHGVIVSLQHGAQLPIGAGIDERRLSYGQFGDQQVISQAATGHRPVYPPLGDVAALGVRRAEHQSN